MPCIHASLPRILMSVMTSQTTGNVTACSTVCSVQHRRKHQSCALLALCGESPVTGGFPSQRASNADSASMSWRHHVHDATQLDMNIHSICFPVNCINWWSLNQHKHPFRLIWRVTYRIHILNVKYATDDTFKLQYVYAWWYASHFAGYLDKTYDDIVGLYIQTFHCFVNFEASGLNYKKHMENQEEDFHRVAMGSNAIKESLHLHTQIAICAGNSPVTRPVTRSFDVFFDLCLNKQLSKQSWGWWFETPSRPLWRHFNEIQQLHGYDVGLRACVMIPYCLNNGYICEKFWYPQLVNMVSCCVAFSPGLE